MSSTIEGRDDWAREDDLDLGQAEDEHLPAAASNGVIEDGIPSEDLKEGSIAHIEEDLPDLVSQNHVSGKADPVPDEVVDSNDVPSSPSTPKPRIVQMGTPDDADDFGSNPDDTPSLRVSSSHAVS